MELYEKIGDVEQLFRTTFDNGWSVSVTFNEFDLDYKYEIQCSIGGFYTYEHTNNPNEILKIMADIQNYEED